MNTSETQWRRVVAAPGSTLHYATRFLGPGQRRRLLSLYAVADQIDAVAYDCSDIGVARTKLEWWAEELGRLTEGNPRHPLTIALGQLPARGLLPLCAATEEFINQRGFTDDAQLDSYCVAHGRVQKTAARLLGACDPDQLGYAANLGAILARALVLADSGRALRRGFSPLPRNVLATAGVTDQSVTAITGSAVAHSMLRDRLDYCLTEIRRMQPAPGGSAPHKLLPLVIQARITAARLNEIRRDDYRVLERSVDITPLRRLWLSLCAYYGSRLAGI